MADQLASPSDLAALVQHDVDTASAMLAIEICTAVVQAAADGQRIVQVVGDTATVVGTPEQFLRLPQWPVTAVSAVTLDGVALTAGAAGSGAATYRLVGDRLYRGSGWQTYCWEPSAVAFTYTHGYATGDQRLQLGRGAVLSLGRGLFENPSGVVREQIDDYAVAYAEAQAALDASPALKAAIRKTYGPRARMVRIQ
ncbi:MAG: hypothetical protein HOV66_03050 [Streptomycetaceae bacterium]|nr:hypothetical protein [Streptomycetaceae bacterium]